jgi:hypothetical protein
VPPAKAGAATATIRLKAIIESRVFIGVSSEYFSIKSMDQKSDASLEKRRYSGSREEVSQGHFVEGRGPSCRVRIKSPLTGHSPKPHLRGRRLRSGLPFFVVVAEKLQRIDDAEALLKSLRKTLTS